jgi:hypothetical protein
VCSATPDWTQQAVALWLEAMPIKEGPVLGKVNKGGRIVPKADRQNRRLTRENPFAKM